MFLSHRTIERLIDDGKIVITPDFDKGNIRPVGVRVHLAKEIMVPEPNQTIDIGLTQELKYTEVDLTKEEFFLEPNGFILAATHEAIQMPANLIAFLDGRSTVARLGLTVHVSSTTIHGNVDAPQVIVFEIKNLGNFRVRLRYMDPVAMIVFAGLDSEVDHSSPSQYQGQDKVTPPRGK